MKNKIHHKITICENLQCTHQTKFKWKRVWFSLNSDLTNCDIKIVSINRQIYGVRTKDQKTIEL